jgi:hypothetical protein
MVVVKSWIVEVSCLVQKPIKEEGGSRKYCQLKLVSKLRSATGEEREKREQL